MVLPFKGLPVLIIGIAAKKRPLIYIGAGILFISVAITAFIMISMFLFASSVS